MEGRVGIVKNVEGLPPLSRSAAAAAIAAVPRIVADGKNVFSSVLGQRRSECSSYLALRRVASLAVKRTHEMNANVQPSWLRRPRYPPSR